MAKLIELEVSHVELMRELEIQLGRASGAISLAVALLDVLTHQQKIRSNAIWITANSDKLLSISHANFLERKCQPQPK